MLKMYKWLVEVEEDTKWHKWETNEWITMMETADQSPANGRKLMTSMKVGGHSGISRDQRSGVH